MHSQIRPSCAAMKTRDHRRLGNLGLFVVGERNNELKWIGVRQRTKADRAMLGLQNPPFVPREIINADIAEYDAASGHRLTGKVDFKRRAYDAAAAVGAHQIFRSDVGRLPRRQERRGYAASILFKASKFDTVLNFATVCVQRRTQHRICPPLRRHDHVRIGNVRRWVDLDVERPLPDDRLTLQHAQGWIRAADLKISRQSANIFKYLQRPRLKSRSARRLQRFGALLDQPESDAPACQLYA